MVTIPAHVARDLGIHPGCKLDWQRVEGRDELLVRVIPDRATMAARLYGAGKHLAPGRDLITELDAERESDG